ncbi:hypothetical protein BDK51DRAFT_30217 [Blyttiomyces helicus]|uniref:Uncharacterized protein n=1 Tax=Blyttiomyces helicus TaxID=388810 RepID=A0A4P9WSH3_9FUNG|nr:hypothetical protein BDK51DRAFT_30217 [Blyttiomyces helicus]|eukprot:RKO93956.1 hypothetical protein BDK51DRAFT_30217 [Blyttiomyces helicus]
MDQLTKTEEPLAPDIATVGLFLLSKRQHQQSKHTSSKKSRGWHQHRLSQTCVLAPLAYDVNLVKLSGYFQENINGAKDWVLQPFALSQADVLQQRQRSYCFWKFQMEFLGADVKFSSETPVAKATGLQSAFCLQGFMARACQWWGRLKMALGVADVSPQDLYCKLSGENGTCQAHVLNGTAAHLRNSWNSLERSLCVHVTVNVSFKQYFWISCFCTWTQPEQDHKLGLQEQKGKSLREWIPSDG